MELAPLAHDDPTWDAMPERVRRNARTVLDAIADRYEGALVDPARLARLMIEEESIGHQSTMEALTALIAHDLLHHRRSHGQDILWIPDRLLATEPRPRPIAYARRNGTRRPATPP